MVKFSILAAILILGAITGGYWYGLNKPVNNNSRTIMTGTPTTSGSAGLNEYTSWKMCTNSSKNFTIKYPSDWATVSTNKADSCQYFDPSSANLTKDLAKVVINTTLDQKSYSDLKTNTQKSTEEGLLLNNRQIEVSGQRVDRVEIEATGVGTRVKGAVTTTYFFGGIPILVVTATETDHSKVPSSSQIFEMMVKSLQF
jgi:hypothetical protein